MADFLIEDGIHGGEIHAGQKLDIYVSLGVAVIPVPSSGFRAPSKRCKFVRLPRPITGTVVSVGPKTDKVGHTRFEMRVSKTVRSCRLKCKGDPRGEFFRFTGVKKDRTITGYYKPLPVDAPQSASGRLLI